jgi:hypothetical protein
LDYFGFIRLHHFRLTLVYYGLLPHSWVYPCLPHLNMCVSWSFPGFRVGFIRCRPWAEPPAPPQNPLKRKDWAVAETTFWSPWRLLTGAVLRGHP